MAAMLPASAPLQATGAAEEYRRANQLFQQQNFADAAESLDRCLREDPGYVAGWTLRGKIAMAFNRFDIAREAFLRAVKLAPASAYSQFMLGFFYYVDNDFVKAVPVLERAAQLEPKDPQPLLYLAMAQDGLAKPDLALELYKKTIQLENAEGKPNPDTHVAYGRLLYSLGRRTESAEQVARVLDLDPNSRDGHYERGRLLYDSGDFAGAAAEGEKAIRQKGSGTTDRQIHFLLTRAYLKTGNHELAELHRKQFETSPSTLKR